MFGEDEITNFAKQVIKIIRTDENKFTKQRIQAMEVFHQSFYVVNKKL